jgi:DNA-binding helix-hairpin-helix protein with protein kinase domain
VQLKAYLATHKIEDTKIANVAAVRSGSLCKAGVVTAADIDGETLHKIPDVGYSIATELINWRRGLEATFQFAPISPSIPLQSMRLPKTLPPRLTSSSLPLNKILQN